VPAASRPSISSASRGCEAERLARAAVELLGDLVEALLAHPGETRSLREVLAKQAVGVLV
jgi:hypothetical protein